MWPETCVGSVGCDYRGATADRYSDDTAFRIPYARFRNVAGLEGCEQ